MIQERPKRAVGCIQVKDGLVKVVLPTVSILRLRLVTNRSLWAQVGPMSKASLVLLQILVSARGQICSLDRLSAE